MAQFIAGAHICTHISFSQMFIDSLMYKNQKQTFLPGEIVSNKNGFCENVFSRVFFLLL